MSPYSEQLALELRRLGIGSAPLERLLAELPQGVMLARAPSGQILFASRQVRGILGDEIAEASSLAESDRWRWKGGGEDGRAYGPDDWPLARALRGETVTAEEIAMVHPDGIRRWIRVSAAPLATPDGRIAAGIALFHDITDQKNAEIRAVALATLARQLGSARTAADVYRVVIAHGRRALGAYAGGIVTPVGDGSWLEFIEAVGYPESLLDRYRRFPADAPVPAAEVLRNGEPLFLHEVEWRARFRGPATASPTRSIAVLPLRVEDRPVAALTLSFDDPREFQSPERVFMLTLADHCAQALERALLYDAEREARAAAEAASREKDEFLAMISHDLRTPLNVLAGCASILRQQIEDGSRLAGPVAALERSVNLQIRLVDDLLDLSRASTGKLHLSAETLSARQAARAAIDAASFAAAERGVSLVLEGDEAGGAADVSVRADAARLQQMLGNLLSNAIRFTPERGTVTLSLDAWARNVAFTVLDSGPGIPAPRLPFIFDRFQQAGREQQGGLGLGLAIVRHLAQAHGGIVYAHGRAPGSGAGFTLLLARADAAATAVPVACHSGLDLAGIDVLALLSASSELQPALRGVLEPLGASLSVVHGAAAAWQAVEQRRPAIVLCDAGLPGSETAAFVRQLREQEGDDLPRLRIAALIPPGPPRAPDRAPLRGCDAALPTPLDAEQLVLVMAGLAGRPHGRHMFLDSGR